MRLPARAQGRGRPACSAAASLPHALLGLAAALNSLALPLGGAFLCDAERLLDAAARFAARVSSALPVSKTGPGSTRGLRYSAWRGCWHHCSCGAHCMHEDQRASADRLRRDVGRGRTLARQLAAGIGNTEEYRAGERCSAEWSSGRAVEARLSAVDQTGLCALGPPGIEVYWAAVAKDAHV